ncbi:signal peptide peptidase SppA [Acetivibrio ethanolgignens]|uniref:Signal peptide peptidase SppA n=1 Tax=Acetivibrio ethanolgignens TaxID=290052 RepID=A0A0V8QC71_9FIRM|nr:signal peptide peptidase SppA [Acetivibrio ethanolgignens]KSV58090.1 signal peptide peptidase SppA [Acetivibrio ethanolgignens]
MKTKQIIGIVVAGAVFISVGVSGVLTSQLTNQLTGGSKQSAAGFFEELLGETTGKLEFPIEPFVGLVRVEGKIRDTGSSTAFEKVGYDHQSILRYIDRMMDSPNNTGILLYVDSPGGGVYESDELYLKLKEYKEETGRPIWAYMGSMACSGGYYISMAADRIVANRNTWTGSIGVIISNYNYKEFFDKLGVKEINYTSGPNKAMGSGGIEATKEQKEIFQGMVDEAYEQFVEIIAEGRNMSRDTVKPLADGRIYTAKQALSLKLIDEIDSLENTELAIRKEAGSGSVIYEPDFSGSSFFSSLFSSFKGIRGKSDVQAVTEMLNDGRNGVPMYYAEPGKQ